MMKAVTAAEMRNIDRIAIEEYAVSGEVLMAYAGRVAANYIDDNFPDASSIAVFCGAGNNGGDGFVAAWLLANRGRSVRIYLAGSVKKLSPASEIFYNICLKSEIPIKELSGGDADIPITLNGTHLIIDALLGTGFEGVPRNPVAEAINLINGSGLPVVSLDLPSGLPSDGCAPEGATVTADVTITMGLPKISLVTYPGKRYTGRLMVADIGFPRSLTESPDLLTEMIDAAYVRRRFPKTRDADSHKNSRDHVLVIGGFDGMEGAALLTASACFQAGAGMVTALTTGEGRRVMAGKIPEMMTASVPGIESIRQEVAGEIRNGSAGEEKMRYKLTSELSRDLGEFFSNGRNYGFVVIGPGMGRTLLSSVLFGILMDRLKNFGLSRILIDGDGLYHLASYVGEKVPIKGADVIITPHFLEASRITGDPVESIMSDRPSSAKKLAHLCGAVALLKGPATIVTDGERSLINTTGNPSLATAGSGDVLSGVIAALASRGISSPEAAALGAYFHGRAADIHAAETKSGDMTASDIISSLRTALAEV
jgi:NAD(P)H-hydrate epimerase